MACIEGAVKDFTVEDEEGAEGLLLGGGGDVVINGEVGEEGFDVAHAECVLFAVKEDEVFDPIDVGLFGADGVVFEAEFVPDMFDKLCAGLIE